MNTTPEPNLKHRETVFSRPDHYPGGQSAPTPEHIDFKPGELLGSVSGELGLREFLEGLGHTFVVTADKESPTSVFDASFPMRKWSFHNPFGRLT